MAETIANYDASEEGRPTGLTSKKEGGVASLVAEKPSTVDETMTQSEEKSLVRRIDLHLMPLLFVSYMIQYLDKTTLGYTAILGLPKDTGLVGDQYSWVSSAFYFGYLVASYPASLGFIKLPLGKYLSVAVLLWAVVLTCNGAASNFVALTVLRVLLGIFESTISPGFTLITGMWYKPSEHPVRACIWYAGNATAAVFGGVLSYAIGHIKHDIEPWRWLFIIFGIVTFLWGCILVYFLPDSPLTAKWLNSSQQKCANNRVQSIQKSHQTKKWEKSQFVEALMDPQTWLLSIYMFVLCLPNGGITNFISLIIQGFGFTVFETLLLGIPGPVLALIVITIIAIVSHRFRRVRCIIMALVCVVSLIGILLVRQLPTENRTGRLLGIYFSTVFGGGFPLCLSMASSNFAGYTKKTTVGAILFVSYCLGNIIGPLVFKAKEAPLYNTAFSTILCCNVIGVLDALALRYFLDFKNKQRDKAQGCVIEAEPKVKPEVQVLAAEESPSSAQLDISDWQNKSFRYFL